MKLIDILNGFRKPVNGVNVTDSRAPGVEFPITQGISENDIMKLLASVGAYTPADLYRTQANIRSAVNFLSNGVGQLPLHVYTKDENGSRTRDKDSLLARVLKNPSPEHTQTELVRSIAASLALYDQVWLCLAPVSTSFHPTGYVLYPIDNESIVKIEGTILQGNLKLHVNVGSDDPMVIEGKNLINIHGWNPHYGPTGISPIESLRETLQEQMASRAFRLATWKNGGQTSSYITRPAGNNWSPEAEQRFVEGWKAYKANGPLAGGTPLLPDGMEIKSVRPTSKEEQWVEAQQIALEEVCRVYHINPSMLGSNNGVTYANMKEFGKLFYTETLGPILVQVQQKLNARLVPMLTSDSDSTDHTYVEFELKQKLQGSFAEEADIINKSVGGAWMTRNEARAHQNLPRIESPEYDEILQPLNMTAGDATQALEAAPEDLEEPKATPSGSTAFKAPKRRVSAEPRAGSRTEDLVLGAITKHAKRQKQVVLTRLGTKDSKEWWDEDRFDKELADDLYDVAILVTQQIGGQVAADLGFSGQYDIEVTRKFLREVAESRASMINATTREAVESALKSDGEKLPSEVFDELASTRGEESSQTLHNTLLAFAGVEAGKQIARQATPAGDPPARAVKTWQTRSGNSRASHAKMNGQTVDIDDKFSNGANWPGDPVLGADGVAGCMCGIEVSIEY